MGQVGIIGTVEDQDSKSKRKASQLFTPSPLEDHPGLAPTSVYHPDESEHPSLPACTFHNGAMDNTHSLRKIDYSWILCKLSKEQMAQ